MRTSLIKPGGLFVAPQFQRVFRELAIDADAVFTHELITPWRTLKDRQNCTLDTTLSDGSIVRFHVKRYTRARNTPAELELAGHRALQDAGVPTANLVAWGVLHDGRSFIIFDDLRDYDAAHKLIAGGLPFADMLEPTADLVASLHNANLHHRDLYLCHIFARPTAAAIDLKVIDVARVRKLPKLTRSRWITKDLAQFWYSTIELPVLDEQRERWLARYAEKRGLRSTKFLRRAIERKVKWIARHDKALRRRQPNRNIPIPTR